MDLVWIVRNAKKALNIENKTGMRTNKCLRYDNTLTLELCKLWNHYIHAFERPYSMHFIVFYINCLHSFGFLTHFNSVRRYILITIIITEAIRILSKQRGKSNLMGHYITWSFIALHINHFVQLLCALIAIRECRIFNSPNYSTSARSWMRTHM